MVLQCSICLPSYCICMCTGQLHGCAKNVCGQGRILLQALQAPLQLPQHLPDFPQ